MLPHHAPSHLSGDVKPADLSEVCRARTYCHGLSLEIGCSDSINLWRTKVFLVSTLCKTAIAKPDADVASYLSYRCFASPFFMQGVVFRLSSFTRPDGPQQHAQWYRQYRPVRPWAQPAELAEWLYTRKSDQPDVLNIMQVVVDMDMDSQAD
jgi:hypothetical protein